MIGKIGKPHSLLNAGVVVRGILSAAVGAFALYAQEPEHKSASKDEQGYRVDKPGTITFTVGVKIKGKVEKPQVMIFLPKEKPVYDDITLTHSFYDDLMKPIPLNPDEK